MNYASFFTNLGFDFNVNLIEIDIEIEQSYALSQKLKESVFYYKSPRNTNTSFYLVVSTLDEEELMHFRRYVWNKNDVDIIFYYPNNSEEIKMLYGKYSPSISNIESELGVFYTNEKDLNKIEQIKLWRFDSGAFWFNYHSCINKRKYKGIDKELASTLQALKNKLEITISNIIEEDDGRDEVVQALIDRTLYIKYLEDNHIINSHFYKHYFGDESINYSYILENNSISDINKLYKIIHEIFNNDLFDKPSIEDKYLTIEVRELIALSFKANLHDGQLRLFDFRFDVLPVEFISYIYEVFLSDKQKENGIYYTPKKLAQLIVDDVITEDRIGPILDPSCGSGMFLITGYQRLLEISKKLGHEPEDSIGKIEHRTKLLSDNIFGIEKQLTAQRFTLFSLSLQIFNGINPEDIKNFIASQLEENKEITLFGRHSFYQNIVHANTLNTSNNFFEGLKFSYIVGNPPFFEIIDTEELQDEMSFLKNYKVDFNGHVNKFANEIVGANQISQCFFLIIKEWSDKHTRFGLVSNSSSFYNDHSKVFQEYFYTNYRIEKIYDLSGVKKILFEKANESVLAIVFTNDDAQTGLIDYYSVRMGPFSKKPFELLIIEEDRAVDINQSVLISKQASLRDYLVGNEYDRVLTERFESASKLEKLLNIVGGESMQGLTRKSNKDISSHFNMHVKEFAKLSKAQRKTYQRRFELDKYLSDTRVESHPIPYIYEYKNISQFKIDKYDGYINIRSINNDNFQRSRDKNIFEGKKVLITRVGTILKAVYTPYDIVFSLNIFGVKLKDEHLSYLVASLFNSYLINYIVDIRYKKRVYDNMPRIDGNVIKGIPIPQNLDEELVSRISLICKDVSDGVYNFSEKKNEINELIYELYELTYWEKQRVNDYFLKSRKIGRNTDVFNAYNRTLKEIVEFYFENPIFVETTSTDFDLVIVKLLFTDDLSSPSAEKTKKYVLNEIFEQSPESNFLIGQEMIFGRNCVYIIKENININWTETKAFEDAQKILKNLIPN